MTRAFLKLGIAKGHGATIMNITSGVAYVKYFHGHSSYSSSKLAFAKIVEYLQAEIEGRKFDSLQFAP